MELLLHKRYPSLAQEIEEERQRKIRDMAFRSTLKEEDNRLSVSFRLPVGSFEDVLSSSPSQDRLGRKSNTLRNTPFSPSIRPKDSTADLMFDMDEDSVSLGFPASPVQKVANWASGLLMDVTQSESNEGRHGSNGKEKLPVEDSQAPSPVLTPKKETTSFPSVSLPSASKPWHLPALPLSKVDMRDIMAQASMGRESSLSLSPSVPKANRDSAIRMVTPKISQKERKKQKNQAIQQIVPHSKSAINKPSINNITSSPWQLSDIGTQTSLGGVIEPGIESLPLAKSVQVPSSSTPLLDLSSRRATSPDTRFSGQHRSSSSRASVSKAGTTLISLSTESLRPLQQLQFSKPTLLTTNSKSYANTARNGEPSIHFTMADIIGQQKREQDLIKEAAAKRSLQDIQEEQAFQEWWDKESRKAQEQEARRNAGVAGSESGGAEGKGTKSEGRRRGKGTRERKSNGVSV
jgi:inhibitor of Bruton tyrosine kinase